MMQQRFGTFICKLFRYPVKDADSLLAELEPPTLADAPAAQADPHPPKCQVGVPPLTYIVFHSKCQKKSRMGVLLSQRATQMRIFGNSKT